MPILQYALSMEFVQRRLNWNFRNLIEKKLQKIYCMSIDLSLEKRTHL